MIREVFVCHWCWKQISEWYLSPYGLPVWSSSGNRIHRWKRDRWWEQQCWLHSMSFNPHVICKIIKDMWKLLDFHIVNYSREQQWMILPRAVVISASLMCISDFSGWAHGCDLSQNLCPLCRWGWDLASSIFYCIYLPWARVSSALANLQSLESTKRVNSWSGSLKQILSEVSQDFNKLMPWAEICLCTVLTRHCFLPAVLVWFPEAHDFNGWCLGYDTGVVCLSVWLTLGIGSCDLVSTPVIG